MIFANPVIGVVTKLDAVTEDKVEKAKKYLAAAGAKEVYTVSSVTGESVEELVERLGVGEKNE